MGPPGPRNPTAATPKSILETEAEGDVTHQYVHRPLCLDYGPSVRSAPLASTHKSKNAELLIKNIKARHKHSLWGGGGRKNAEYVQCLIQCVTAFNTYANKLWDLVRRLSRLYSRCHEEK